MTKTIVEELALERCRKNLSHIMALVYTEDSEDAQMRCRSLYNLIRAMNADFDVIGDSISVDPIGDCDGASV